MTTRPNRSAAPQTMSSRRSRGSASYVSRRRVSRAILGGGGVPGVGGGPGMR